MSKRLMIIFIIAANASDAILTHLGIRTKQMEEGNPIMAWAYNHSLWLFFLVKLSLPLLLLLLLLKIPKPNRTTILLLTSTCGIYLYVMMLHGYWLTLLYPHLFEHLIPNIPQHLIIEP